MDVSETIKKKRNKTFVLMIKSLMGLSGANLIFFEQKVLTQDTFFLIKTFLTTL
tara:strand:- start:649 stop:810 length:162 start_codon:yes stop_codon:yes gene_type:complete